MYNYINLKFLRSWISLLLVWTYNIRPSGSVLLCCQPHKSLWCSVDLWQEICLKFLKSFLMVNYFLSLGSSAVRFWNFLVHWVSCSPCYVSYFRYIISSALFFPFWLLQLLFSIIWCDGLKLQLMCVLETVSLPNLVGLTSLRYCRMQMSWFWKQMVIVRREH